MKTIILMRHSKPQKTAGIPNELIPLSDDGLYLAQKLFQDVLFEDVHYTYASPYQRAFDTAKQLTGDVIADRRLVERKLGDEATLNAEFWGRQYADHDFKNTGGESLNEAKARMTEFMDELLFRMGEDETAVVVSHAAAICSYLLNFCTITVSDAERKLREIKFQSEIVLSGKISTPCAFVLQFEGNQLTGIYHTEGEK